MISPDVHRLLKSAAAAADLTDKQTVEALIRLFAEGEIEIVKMVLARAKREK